MAKKIPIVSFFEVLKNASRILKNPLPFHNENFEKHGDVFKVNLSPGRYVIFTRDPGFVKHILQKNHRSYYKSSLQSKDLRKYVGEGLLTANGDKWLQQRRLVQPAFHKKKLQGLVTTIQEVIKEELSRIKPKETTDVFPIMSDLAFKVVAKSLFSYTDNTGDVITRLQDITKTVQKTLIKEIRQPYKRWWFHLRGDIKNTLDLSKEAQNILHHLIDQRKKSEHEYHDLLDMLLSARYEDGSTMDNEQLIDEILILFIAGYETTSNALTFTLMLLAKNPEIQEKVHQEVDALSGIVDPLDRIAGLQYTKQCIEETMRLYPPVYFSDREAIEDDTYKNLNIKKGTTILISFFEIHRNSNLWKDPLSYNPDRFDPELDKKHYADGYFPFGAGPRMCIGNNFAMYEMILAISELVGNYKILPDFDQIQAKPLITLKPLHSLLRFVSR